MALNPLHAARDAPPVEDLRDPERALAVAYAPRSARPALATLFQLDERLAGIVSSTSQPMIGLMRLAWWREALDRLDRDAAPAEPLLRDVAALLLPIGLSGVELSGIEDGWAALLDGEADPAAIARHGRERGGRLFLAAARILGADDSRIEQGGTGWALVDLACRHALPELRDEALRQAVEVLAALPSGRWEAKARPLAMLATLALRDAVHDGERRQGSPSRLARMLALRLTGR